MSVELAPSEAVIFELSDRPRAERLSERLRRHGRVRVREREGAALVSVELRPEADELAVLLRAAKQWLDESPSGAIRFNLDGRAYVLEPGTAIRLGA